MKNTASSNTDVRNSLIKVAVGTAAILAIPLIAMQFSDDVQWGLFDFIVIGGLLLVAGTVYALLAHTIKDKNHRLALLVVSVLVVLYLWAELAVGIFTNWGS